MSKSIHAFAYQGFDASGRAIKSHIYAEHVLLAEEYLISQGFVIQKIHKTFWAPQIRFNAQDLLLITQQLNVLILAHLPLIFCLTTIGKQFNSRVNGLFKQMIFLIEQGKPLNVALQLFPRLFPHYYVNLIKVGEESGKLPQVLLQLATYQEKMLARMGALKKALLYPLFVLAASVFITVALLVFIVPQFQLLFSEAQNQLPFMTRFVFYLSDSLRHISLLTGTILWICLCVFISLVKNHHKCINMRDELIFHTPILGNIIHLNQQIRYLRSLSLALQAGLPLTHALALATNVMHNTRFAKHILHIRETIQSGVNLKHTLLQTAQFCDIVIQLVAIGEQTGQLPTLLAESAQILEQRLDKQIERMSALLQPILILFLGVILGGLIIALYLPVFKLGTLY